MALYTEQSADILASMLQAGEEERRRKQQAKALQEYNARKQQADNKYDGGLGGFLGNIVGGIGKSIGDVGYALGGLFGTAGASVKDILEGTAGTGENQRAFKRTYYGAKDDKDAAAKAAGNALNAATTLATTVVPGVAGAGTAAGKVLGGTVANTAAGALGGVADEFAQQGSDARLDSAVNRAISGAAAGLATGGLNRKIGNATGNVSSKLLNNKLATSTIGRGALSGAVGGATGAGTSAALGGGDIAQAALQGGLTGAVAGGTQAGLMDAGRNIIGKVGNRKTATTQTVEPTTKTTADELDIPDYTKPKDWSGKELVLEKKGTIGALGDKIKNVSKGIKDQDVYNSLYSKTAEKVNRNNSIERLRELGFEPKDYKNAADVSTAVNKFFNDLIENSGASITDNDLTTRLYNPDVTFQTDNLQKSYETKINNLMTSLEKGAMPGNYNAKDLLDASRKFSDYAATEYRKGIDVNGSDIGNGRSDLGDAYMKVSRDLRSLADRAMDGLGDNYTRSQLTQMLENMNAPKKTIEYFRDFRDLADGIRKTAVLEDARQINSEMSKTKIRRNANAGNSKGLINRLADKTGVSQIVDAVAEPIGRVTGAAAEKVGTGLQKLDKGIQNMQSTPVAPMNTDTQLLLGNIIGRTQGQAAAGEKVQNARRAEEYQNLEDMFANITATPTTEPMYPVQRQTSQIEAQLADISNGMSLALAAGDFSAYNQLANLYKNTYSIYEMQNEMAGQSAGGTSNMSTAEKNQIAKLQSAGTALDQLESLYQKAGGGQGIIGGNIANFLGGLGLNSDVNTYNQLAQGLINQIGAAIGKTDSLNTEGEVQRALSLVPKITDDNQTAMNKIATLRSLLQTNTGTYNQLYGA